MTIARCPPNQGPGLHNHDSTYETFTVLEGTFLITWNKDGSENIISYLNEASNTSGIEVNASNIMSKVQEVLVEHLGRFVESTEANELLNSAKQKHANLNNELEFFSIKLKENLSLIFLILKLIY